MSSTKSNPQSYCWLFSTTEVELVSDIGGYNSIMLLQVTTKSALKL